MPGIDGLHHVAVPAADALSSSEWYEQVLGFSRFLIKEEEGGVLTVALRHPSGVVLFVHQGEPLRPGRDAFAAFALEVPDRTGLKEWERWLTHRGADHSGVRPAHLGWTLDVMGPDGFPIQLHTREPVSADDL
jgi:catechol 2,3-dioxygenase-like lactoylglutathione lyase family enzyme